VGLFFETGDQGLKGDFGEGGDAEVGVGEVVVGGGGAGTDDGVHVGAGRGEAAGVRVFEGDGRGEARERCGEAAVKREGARQRSV
jgi:hypothetical protein